MLANAFRLHLVGTERCALEGNGLVATCRGRCKVFHHGREALALSPKPLSRVSSLQRLPFLSRLQECCLLPGQATTRSDMMVGSIHRRQQITLCTDYILWLYKPTNRPAILLFLSFFFSSSFCHCGLDQV